MVPLKLLFHVLIASTLIAPPVYAKVVLTATRSKPVTVPGEIAMPLNDAGATSLKFSGKGTYVIKYSAECAAGEGGHVYVVAAVDGLELPPGGAGAFAPIFCGANFTPETDGWVTAHHDFVTHVLGSGLHTVQITVIAPGPGGGRLDDASLVVTK